MMIRSGVGRICIALALTGGASLALAAPATGPRALNALETGLWELKGVGTDTTSQRLCISDMRQLLQPLDIQPICKQFVGEDVADRVTASFDCAAQGQGRTSVRVETPRLAQIESQGIAGGRPFSMRMEARRVGACQAALR
jgi:hypothetical protein